jgi:ABC-type sugar transport system permease subunit/ABC-type glycerol-3-phosphate transport system substrate-binding protein
MSLMSRGFMMARRRPDVPVLNRFAGGRAGQVSLRLLVGLFALMVAVLVWWTWRSMSTETADGREVIVFWGSRALGDDVYTAIHQFEQRFTDAKGQPKYKVVMGTAVAKNFTGDAQRLLCAVAGGVPPDVVWFDRFAVGEWAGRGALTDLSPYLKDHNPKDPYHLDLGEYYDWAVEEASYTPPGSKGQGIYGIPTGVDIRALYANADLLRQEGLVDGTGEPRPPRNWAELREYATRLTRYHTPGDRRSGIARLGFAPNYGNSWLYLYAWQAGGEFLNPDRTRVTLTAPPVVRALQYMTDIYDDLGGFTQVDAFQSSFQSGELDPFLRGQVAMKIDGDWSLESIADWRRDMDFIITPAPMPQDQLDAGRAPITWAGGWVLVIPSTAQNKLGAWELIRFLRSREISLLLEQGWREQKASEGKLYLPKGLANRVIYEQLIQEHIFDNPHVPRRFKEAYQVLKELMPGTRIRPVTPVGQVLWEKHRSAYEKAATHEYRGQVPPEKEVEHALAVEQAEVQRRLDEVLEPMPPETQVNWTPYFALYAALVVLPFVLMLWAYTRRKRAYGYRAGEVGAALLFMSPWVVGFVVFVGGPILFSILFSFTRYDVLNPAHYVGLDNYRRIVQDELFFKSLGNTAFMLLRIPLTMAVSLAIAMLLNRAIRGIGLYRTAFYMPAIVPLVAASLLWVWIFNPSMGALSQFLRWLFDTSPFELIERIVGGKDYHFTVPLWLQDKHWSKPSLIIMNLWAAGGGMITWLAGLQSIPPPLYEAASIDGAGPWKRFIHVTLPMLSPYILFNAVIGVIGTMQMFGEAFIMTEGGPADSTLFYAYYLFKEAFQFFKMGYASALAWILFLIVLALTLIQWWLSQKWVHYERA